MIRPDELCNIGFNRPTQGAISALRKTNIVSWSARDQTGISPGGKKFCTYYTTRKAFINASKSCAREEYKISLTEYNKALRNSMTDSWRKQCEGWTNPIMF